jgi:hypothetical protein
VLLAPPPLDLNGDIPPEMMSEPEDSALAGPMDSRTADESRVRIIGFSYFIISSPAIAFLIWLDDENVR